MEGFSFTIQDKEIQKLKDIQKHFDNIAEASEKTQERVINAFKKMRTDGLEPFIASAKNFKTEMLGLKVTNTGLSSVTSQAKTAADEVNRLVESINKLLSANNRLSDSNSKDANLSKVNQLYKERLQIEERLQKMMLKGAKGGTVSEYESSSISKLAARAQAVEREIEALKNKSNISTQTILAIMKHEDEYTKAVARMSKERIDVKNAEAEQQKKLFEQERARREQEARQQAENAKKEAYNRNTSIRGSLDYSSNAKTYNEEKQAIEYLTIARNNYSKANSDYKQVLDSLNKAIRKHQDNLKNAAKTQDELTEAQNRRNKSQRGNTANQADKEYLRTLRDYNNAMKSSEATVTQRTNKLAKLRQVEQQLSQDEAKYAKELDRVRNAINKLTEANEKQEKSAKKVKDSHRSLMDTSGQLQRKLALLFSVSAIQGYVSKLVEVRGEFEMQQRSLQVLLQNKDEANELWDKTVALAVKSPFRVKDLVTYTKQLAAYRVEADKLYETNRMLADVSAGLGVDMNRLILAYGQVKAANYLRGTELRQFSEAGVNMLGELAKYFEEIEGRAVSVGDVFERVSKRMVSFKDVNEVFKRLTSEGGIFFKMQEKQSETLQGMVMNFRDSMDLMLNDIGKDQSSMLKESIRLAKEFVDNWREFAPLVKTAGVAFLAAFGVQTLTKIYRVARNFMALFVANPAIVGFSVLAGTIGLVATYLYQASQAQSQFNAAMQEVESENISTLEENIELYHKLADTINDATQSYEERNKAMKQLKSTFKDILPMQYTEEEYVKNIASGYKDAEKAMFDYYNTKALEQKKNKAEQMYSSKIDTEVDNLISEYKRLIDGINIIGVDESEAKIKLRARIANIINSVTHDIQSGKISVNEMQKEISERLSTYVGKDDTAKKIIDRIESHVDIVKSIQEISDIFNEYFNIIEGIQGLPYETYELEQASKIIIQEKKNIEMAVSAFDKAVKLYRQYINVLPSDAETIAEQRSNIEDDVQGILDALPKEMEAYAVHLNNAFTLLKEKAQQGAAAFESSIQTIKSELYYNRDENGVLGGIASALFSDLNLDEKAKESAKTMMDNLKEGLEEESKNLKLNDFQKATIRGINLIAEKFKINADKLSKYIPQYGETLSEVRTKLEAEISMIKDRIKQWDSSISTGYGVLTPDVLTEKKAEIDELRNYLLPALEALFKLLGGEIKGTTKRDKTIDERIKVIDDMNKKYKELNKTLSKTESLEGAFKAYQDAFATAYNRSDVKQMSAQEFASKVLNFPNEDEIVKWLDNLSKTVKSQEDKIKVQLKKGEYEMDLRVRTKIEDDKLLIDQIEEMFSGYEMSLELQKLNIPPDLAKSLFNVDSLSLDALRKNLQSRKGEFIGTDQEEQYKKYLKKIDEMEDKANVERLKKYTKYLIQAQGERVKIKMDEMRQLSEIETLNFTESQKSMARMAIQQESRQKMDKLEWDEFKNSGMYVQLFEDLDLASTKALERMRNRLIEMKSSLKDLDADDLRNLYNQIEKLDNELATRNPYKHMIDGAKDYIDAIRESKRVERELDLQSQVTKGMQSKEVSLSEELAKQKTIYEQMSKSGKATKDDLDKQRLKISLLNAQLASIKAQLAAQGKLTKGLEEELDGYKATRKLFTGKAGEIGKDISEVANALPQIAGELENVFGTMDAGTRDTIDSIATIGSGIGDAIQGFASGNYIQAALGVAKALGGIFQIGDKKKERQIQREIQFVEDLERAYAKLEKAIDSAYSIDTLQSSGKAAKDNLEAQIDSYEKMIASEEDKKKTDQDRIKEWQLAIEDLIEQKAELDKQLVSTATGGIMDDVLSAAQEFTNAWLEAFNETGDGLSGLKDNFKETMLEMIKQQASMLITQSYVDSWKKQLEQYINPDDLELTTNEAKKWVDSVTETLPMLDEALENYFKAMQQAGVDLGKEGELSGLQRGIQGITEQTAEIIAAYLNSIRFFMVEHGNYLSRIAASFDNTEAENPMVSQLRIIAQQTSAINTLLQSLTKGGHSMGGYGLKVFIS